MKYLPTGFGIITKLIANQHIFTEKNTSYPSTIQSKNLVVVIWIPLLYVKCYHCCVCLYYYTSWNILFIKRKFVTMSNWDRVESFLSQVQSYFQVEIRPQLGYESVPTECPRICSRIAFESLWKVLPFLCCATITSILVPLPFEVK